MRSCLERGATISPDAGASRSWASPPPELMGVTAGDVQGGHHKHAGPTVKKGKAHSPTGYPLTPGVPGSLVGDKGTAPMTNFTTTWVLWYPLATGAGDPDDA